MSMAFVGSVVHFVLPEDEKPPLSALIGMTRKEGEHFASNTETLFTPRWRQGDHCAAVVVGAPESGAVNLQVFMNVPMMAFYRDVPYSAFGEPGTWHWPENEKEA